MQHFFYNRMIESGIDINERHPLGWTVLHVAAVNGNPRFSDFLVFFFYILLKQTIVLEIYSIWYQIILI